MQRKNPPKIILASASKIRAEILTNAGINFVASPTNINEDEIKKNYIQKGKTATNIAKKLAQEKAKAYPANKNEIVIGADQVLELEGRIYDKPKTLTEARLRLLELKGKEHKLIGAVYICQKEKKDWCYISTTSLHMRKFSDKFLNSYLEVEGENLTTCVGAYKFEGRGALLFDNVQGDFFSILGLSLLPLLKELRHRGALRE